MEIYNENFFTDLSPYVLEWELMQDGVATLAGRIESLAVAPQQHKQFSLGFSEADFCPEAKEILLNVSYRLKKKQPLLAIGHTIAEEQLSIKEYDTKAAFVMKQSSRPVKIIRFEKATNVEGYDWLVAFDLKALSTRCSMATYRLWLKALRFVLTSGAPQPRTTTVLACTNISRYGATLQCTSKTLRQRLKMVWLSS